MGTSQSSSKVFLDDLAKDKDYRVLKAQREMQRKIEIPLQVMVAHYTPSSFPVFPRIGSTTQHLCIESWKKLLSTDVPDPYGGPAKSGMTAFYTEFYDR